MTFVSYNFSVIKIQNSLISHRSSKIIFHICHPQVLIFRIFPSVTNKFEEVSQEYGFSAPLSLTGAENFHVYCRVKKALQRSRPLL